MNTRLLSNVAAIGISLIATGSLAQAVQYLGKPHEPAEFEILSKRLEEIGARFPMWFYVPDKAPLEGNGRPKTPLSQTKSSMVLMEIGEDGRPKSCEVLITRNPMELAKELCAISVKRMAYPASSAPSRRAFWFHVYSGEPRLTVVDIPLTK